MRVCMYTGIDGLPIGVEVSVRECGGADIIRLSVYRQIYTQTNNVYIRTGIQPYSAITHGIW